MTTAKEIQTGPHADTIRATWAAFQGHCLAMVEVEGKGEPAILCDRCAAVIWRLTNDSTRDRHALFGDCCEAGADLFGTWSVAVNAFVEYLGRNHAAKQRELAGIQH